MTPREFWIALPWLCWVSYWGLAAARARPPEQSEARGSRLLHLGILAVAFVLLFVPAVGVGPLGWRFVPAGPVAFVAGIAISVVGLGFATWAQLHLGPHWSGVIGRRSGHALVQTGPYAWVRHPMYSGILLAFLGTALGAGELRALLGAALAILAYARKVRIEEHWLREGFGPAYDDYRSSVGGLVPRLRRPTR